MEAKQENKTKKYETMKGRHIQITEFWKTENFEED